MTVMEVFPWCRQGPCLIGQVEEVSEETLLVIYHPVNVPARMLAMDFTEQEVVVEKEVQKEKEI